MALSDFAKNLLEGKNFATIATLMADGAPQASIVWVDTDGTHVIFNTAEGRTKPKNMRRDARVSVAVFNMEQPYQSAIMQGRVTEMTNEGADAHIDKMAKKYMGVDAYPFRQPGEKRVIVTILPESVNLMGEE